MPWPRPTLTGLRQLARSYFTTRLPGADLTLRRSILGVVADTLAALVNGVYGYLDWIIRQCFASTADWDYLLIQGSEYGLAPTGAVQAAGFATFGGTVGAPIIAGTLVQDQQNPPNEYATQAPGVIGGGGTVQIAIQAVAGGAAQNLTIGATLVLVVAIANVNANATVADDGSGNGLTGGLDSETIGSFRARVLARKQKPPQGGDADDYVAWARAVPGVTRAWTYPANRGAGTVDLTFTMDGRASVIPLGGDVTNVQAAIDAKRPVSDDSVVFAPIATAVAFTIHGSFTADQEAAIQASLGDMFLSDAVPGGAYNPATQTTFSGGLSLQDQIIPAIAAGADGVPFNLTIPNADVAGSSGHILTLGVITWLA